jgi:hypothetical protein
VARCWEALHERVTRVQVLDRNSTGAAMTSVGFDAGKVRQMCQTVRKRELENPRSERRGLLRPGETAGSLGSDGHRTALVEEGERGQHPRSSGSG